MSLEHYVSLVYCSHCEAICIDYKEAMIEYHSYYRFWNLDGELDNGESDFCDIEVNKEFLPTCIICENETELTLSMKKEDFLHIIKHCYRDTENIDKLFKIELKESTKSRNCMITPTLQEIKEAITVDLI